MKTILVLAMHGAPPNDFPRKDLDEFMDLHHRFEHITNLGENPQHVCYMELHSKLRNWPRTAQNDPFYAGSTILARHLKDISGLPVVMGFNEFCAPSLDEALEQAATTAEYVFVITPMMTRGGEHSERDIPAAITRVQSRHPAVKIQYVWPFEVAEVARFLARQLKKYQ